MTELPQHGVLEMIFTSGPIVQAVLLLLIFLSFASWAITAAKYQQFKKAKIASQEFSTLFWDARNLARTEDSAARLRGAPLAKMFMRGYKELSQLSEGKSPELTRDAKSALEMVELTLRRAELDEVKKLEGGFLGITFLATVASAAPFIGLFGTVWGIMNAFHGLSSAKASTIQAVAPGISEALVATAVGLAAAIPAAVAYNYFVVDIRRFRESMNEFIGEFLTISRAYFS